MVAAIIPAPEQIRTDFGVGASIAAAAIGLSEYVDETPTSAWLELTGRFRREENQAMRWGHILEPAIRAAYIERNRVTVHVPPRSLFHSELPFVRATPDGIVVDEASGQWRYVAPQVKNVNQRQAPQWAHNGIPRDYMIQGVVELAVTSLPRIDFAVLIGGGDYQERTLWRDLGLEASVLEALQEFWGYIERDEMPPVDRSRKLQAYLLAQQRRLETVTATPEDDDLIEKWRETACAIKLLELEEREYTNQVVARMNAASAKRLQSATHGRITIGKPRSKVGWKGIAQDLAPLVLDFDARVDAATTTGKPSVHRPKWWTAKIEPVPEGAPAEGHNGETEDPDTEEEETTGA